MRRGSAGVALRHSFTKLDEWKAAARAKTAPKDAALIKTFIADVVKDVPMGDDTRAVYRFTISTGSVDRDRDTIDPAGWQLDNYRANPVVLFAHDYDEPPLGQAVEISTDPTRLSAGMRFDSDISPFAKMIEAMVERKTLRATSVGFRPEKYVLNDERRGVDFVAQELLEFSIVPVPANPDALIEARAAGVDLAPLKGWAERVMDEWSEERGLWLPKSTIETLFKLLGGRPFVSTSLGRVELDKGVTGCPKGAACPNDTGTIQCPAAADCPIVGASLFSGTHGEEGGPEPVRSVKDGEIVEISDELVRLAGVPAEDDGLEIDSDVLQAGIRGAFEDVINETVGATMRRHTGRVD